MRAWDASVEQQRRSITSCDPTAPQACSLSCPEALRQVYSLSWNTVNKGLFLSGSWDDSIKLWDLAHPVSLRTFQEHTYCVYGATWWVMGAPGVYNRMPRRGGGSGTRSLFKLRSAPASWTATCTA